VYVKAWQPELWQGAKSVGTIPTDVWLQVEKTSDPYYLVTYRDGKGGSKHGWIHRDEVHLERALTKKDWDDVNKSTELLLKGRGLAQKASYADAQALYEESLRLRKRVLGDDHPVVVAVMLDLGNVLRLRGRDAEAEKQLAAALSLRKATLGDHPYTALAMNELAVLYQKMGRCAEAETLYRQSLDIREATQGKDHLDLVTTLSNVAHLYYTTDRYVDAEHWWRRSLLIQESHFGKDAPQLTPTLHSLSAAVRHVGRYQEAEQFVRRGLAINEAQRGPDHVDTADSVATLAELCRVMGRLSEAEPLRRRSLAIREAKFGKDHSSTIYDIHALGNYYTTLGRYAEAEERLRRSLKLAESAWGKDDQALGAILRDLGVLCEKTGRDQEAELAFRRALGILEAKRGRDHLYTGLSLRFLATLYQKMGRLSEAEPLLERVVQIRETKQGKDHWETSQARSNLAGLYVATGREAKALAAFDEARRATRRFVTQLLPTLNEEQQRSYLRATDAFAEALSLGMQKGPSDHAAAGLSASWLANGKGVQQEARAFAAQLQSIENPQARPVAEQLRKVRETLTRRKSEPAVAGLDSKRNEELALLETRDRELTAQLQSLGGRTGRGGAWTELDSIRAALAPSAVLIDVARLDVYDFHERKHGAPRYVAWVTPKKGAVRVIDLGDVAAIDVAVSDMQKELASASEKVKDQGEEEAEKALRAKARTVAQRVLEPLLAVEEVKEAQQWVVCPDGKLWLLPWAALPLADDKYLVEDYLIRMVSAGRDVAVPPDRRGSKTSEPLIVADPDFDLTRDKAARLARQVAGGASGQESRSGNTLSEGLKLGRVQRLPATAAEAELIAPSMKALLAQTPRQFTGERALEAVVKAAHQPRMLVLSTHGFFLAEQEGSSDKRGDLGDSRAVLLTKDGKPFEEPLLRCGLLLAACNDQPKAGQTRPGDDGVLTGLEVVGLDLRGCELVVLSACETGLGDVRNGEGVAGLRQAFQLAGAESVLASLWKVPDRETAQLMVGVFERLAAGKRRGAALAETQRQLIHQRRSRHGAAHPYYWAAFSIVGQENSSP
jgi:CHAT domain-containing protein/Flp pilus assembly protein TadD